MIRIKALDTSGRYLFAGTEGGGIFRSTDNGEQWSAIDTTILNLHAMVFAFKGTDLYAGTFQNGILHSTDRGTTWNPLQSEPFDDWVAALALPDSIIFAGANYGSGPGIISGRLWRSANNGQSWMQRNSGFDHGSVNMMKTVGSSIFLGTSTGLSFSTDYGESWHKTSFGVVNMPDVTAMTISEATLFVGCGSGVFRSTDSGKVWVAGNPGSLSGFGVSSLVSAYGVLFAGTWSGGVFLSSDKGDNWMSINNGLTDPYIQTLMVSAGELIAGTITGGVFRRPFRNLLVRSNSSLQLPHHGSTLNKIIQTLLLRQRQSSFPLLRLASYLSRSSTCSAMLSVRWCRRNFNPVCTGQSGLRSGSQAEYISTGSSREWFQRQGHSC